MRAFIMPAVVAFAAVFAAATSHATSVTLLAEDFSEEAASGSVLNFTALDSFTVADGAVDLIATFGYGIGCASTGCLDLDGSRRDAGKITTAALNFLTGYNYELSFNISGNQRNTGSDTVTVGIDNSVLAAADFTKIGTDPFELVTIPFTVAANTSGTLFFDHAGGDNIGIILDSVRLTGVSSATVVPAPAALPQLVTALGAFAALGFSRRRRA